LAPLVAFAGLDGLPVPAGVIPLASPPVHLHSPAILPNVALIPAQVGPVPGQVTLQVTLGPHLVVVAGPGGSR
jgi:hypothetical protein